VLDNAALADRLRVVFDDEESVEGLADFTPCCRSLEGVNLAASLCCAAQRIVLESLPQTLP
jgi:hypothetical protein